MTRPVYTDLILPFTLGANTEPNTTDAAVIIVRLFKAAYGIINETYVAETTHAILDTENVYAAIIADAETIIKEMNKNYAKDDSKSVIVTLSEETIKIIKRETVNDRKLTSRVRLWNRDSDWA